jgi:hypothetical protein
VKKTIRVRVEFMDDGEPVASAGRSASFEGDEGDYFSADVIAETLAYTLQGVISLGVSPPAELVAASLIDKLVEHGGHSPGFRPVADAALDYLAAHEKKVESVLADEKGGAK